MMLATDGKDEDAEDRPDGEVNCSYCKVGGLTWVHTGVRWRLVGERGKLHVCTGAPGSADDFD